jgi:S-formylglutathione hydrolase FrmB
LFRNPSWLRRQRARVSWNLVTMVASQPTSLKSGQETAKRRRRGRVAMDLLVLFAIVVIGAVGALEAGIWAMPTYGSPVDHGGTSGQMPGLGAAGSAVTGAVGSGGTGDGAASPVPGGASPSAPTPSTDPGASAHGTPWTAWKPAGPGSITGFKLPAPWVGGSRQTITAMVYLPGGYTTSNRAYPVIYEAPFSYQSWNMRSGVKAMLDGEITSGAIPASIVVFVQPVHGPYHDTECVNSADGSQRLETFFSTTLVQAVDSRYRTIPTPAARSVLGFSQGGFCGPMLALRHPDVFSTALAISGYYQAGIRDHETPFAWRVFGSKPSIEAAYSPLRLVGQLGPAQRAAMLLVLEADPAQPFYGPQYTAMIAAARQAGVAVRPEPLTMYHSWIAVKEVLPRMLRALAAHEVALGVFG